jgi:uncharacterized protein
MSDYLWGHNRRFNAYSNYIKASYGGRIQKVTIDAGFTCPNRDGSIGTGGCSFCNNNAFNPSYCQPRKSVHQQIEEGIEFHKTRYRRSSGYIAYFQAYSNTYASLSKLKEIYEPALRHVEIQGISIGTRPDCMDEVKLEYFAELAEQTQLTIEYGIESVYDETLKRVNRGHGFEKTKWAIEESATRGIKCGGHLIIGLPGESREQILEEAAILSALPLHSIKFHQLQLVKGTQLEKEYAMNPDGFHFFDLDEYIDLIIDFVELLNPKIIIERFAGEATPDFNLTPKLWGLRYDQALNLIEKRMQERDSWQGKYYH